MRLIPIGIALLLATACFADIITLKNGRVINGTYLGGSARTVRVEIGDRVETFDISEVARIEFMGGAGPISRDDNRPVLRRAPSSSSDSDQPTLRRAPSSSSDSDQPTLRRADSTDNDPDRPILRRGDPTGGGTTSTIMRPDPADTGAPPHAPIDLAAGTNFVVRMIDGVDSETVRVGQTFAAALDEPVKNANGDVLLPRGSDVLVKLVDSKESGKLTGRAELTLDLAQIKVDGRFVDINTQTISRESSSRGERTAKVAGGAAAAGAIIGAIAGGGKGAAVGAAAGGAAGAGAEVVTKGQRVKIPSETRLTFVLDSPLRI